MAVGDRRDEQPAGAFVVEHPDEPTFREVLAAMEAIRYVLDGHPDANPIDIVLGLDAAGFWIVARPDGTTEMEQP